MDPVGHSFASRLVFCGVMVQMLDDVSEGFRILGVYQSMVYVVVEKVPTARNIRANND